jgi:hypothetical protein
MHGKVLRRAFAAVVLFSLGVGVSPSALSADSATTSFGRSLFAVLDDDGPLIRSYGWDSLAWLGKVSSPNALHTAAFKCLLNDDGQALVMEALLAKLRDKSFTEVQAKAANAEYDNLRQAVLGVPEIAALLVSSPAVADSVSANDLGQIKQVSTRARPEIRPVRLTSATDDVEAELKSQRADFRDVRHEAATSLTGLQLDASQLDGVEGLLKDASVEIDRNRADPQWAHAAARLGSMALVRRSGAAICRGEAPQSTYRSPHTPLIHSTMLC